jgi:O-succinylbenzoate synthase
MRIDSFELREMNMDLQFRFETSFGVQTSRRILLVTLHTGGVDGYGECVAGDTPGYSYETTDTCKQVIEDILAPRLVGRDVATPDQLLNLLADVRGHNMAVAAVEMAFWDAWAKQLGVPLWQLLGGQLRPIPVGISIGLQASVEDTVEKALAGVENGYARIKLKIAPGRDVDRVAGVREALPNVNLTVDANSAYQLSDAPRLRELDAFGLDYIEQPLAHDDLIDHAELQRQLATPICLDESIHSPEDARKGLQLGSGRIINLKVGRVRGFRDARRVHDVARAFGAPVWCGGMLESGIGRAANLHLSTLEGFTLPGDTSSASRYWAEDIVQEPLEARNGMQVVPEHGPGLGVALNERVVERTTTDVRTVS